MEIKTLQQANIALDQILAEKRRKKDKGEVLQFVKQMGDAIAQVMMENDLRLKETIREAFSQIQIKVPEVKVPDINIPEIKVPHVTVPPINVPQVKIPKIPAPVVHVAPPEVKVPEIKIPEVKVQMPDTIQATLSGVSKTNPLPVIMTDLKGRPLMNIGGGTGGQKVVQVKGNIEAATNRTVSNVTMALASTEYSYTLPNKTKIFRIKLRDSALLQLAFASGESSTNYVTIYQRGSYGESGLDMSGVTLYFQSPTAAQVAEIISYA